MSRPSVGIALGMLSVCAMFVEGKEKDDSGKAAEPAVRSGVVLFPPGQSIPAAGPRRFGQIGRGPDFRSIVMGTADVFDNGPYDLFLMPNRLFPFRGFDDDGTPMYGNGVITKGQSMHGVIITGGDGVIYGVFGEAKKVRVCKFDRATLTFEPYALSGELSIPGGIGVGMASTIEPAGRLHVYFSIGDTIDSGPQQFVNNEEHVALRHPVINVSVKAIPDPKTGCSNLIVGDTGRIWFCRFSGEFSANGSPIYRAPRPIKAEGVHLTLGELPVISPGDIDGDGLVDMIVGNDAGQLLFVKNIGSAGRPAFDNPVPVPAGGDRSTSRRVTAARSRGRERRCGVTPVRRCATGTATVGWT